MIKITRNGYRIFIVSIFCLFGVFHLSGSQCTWPSDLVSSTWVDNVHGDLVFATTTMSGWSFSITTSGTGQQINDWECVLSDQFDSDGYLVMRSVNNFTLFVTSKYYAYVCLKMKKITNVSYRYYIFEPEQPNINFERYLVSQNPSLSSVGTTCYESYGASGSEYRVILKSGSESQARLTCPWIFLGRFDYYHTANGVSTCTAGNNDMDVCTDKQLVSLDFVQCTTDVMYSGQTSVSCVDNVPVGTATFITVYTESAVNGVNTFKFSCLGVSGDLTTVSVAPEYCRKSQSTSAAPSGGALVTLTSITELCRTCEALTNPDGGNVTIQTDGADTVAYYTCASEYDLYGDSNRTCQSDETWTGSPPACKCKFPSSPVNGGVTVSSDGLLATYTCDSGYVLTGNQYRTCQSNGNAWNGTVPTCDTCDSLTNITNGLTQLSSEGITTIALFSCNVDHSLSGATSMACQADGTWNDTSPTCVACGSLVVPTLGTINKTTDGYQTTANFYCDSGYQVSGLTSLTCKTDGLWNGTEPTCICESPSAPVSGSVSLSTDGMTATYTCDAGYTMAGQPTRDCLLGGSSWTNTAPTCELCSTLTNVVGGVINYTSNGIETVATYTCQTGYTLNGDQIATCASDGSWSQTSSSCVLCPTLTNPSAGGVQLSTNGTVSMATYSCSAGYDLIGDTTRVCQTDGTWTNTEPSCGCTTPGTPANGAVNVTGDVIQYTCSVGYTLHGVHERWCLYDGSGWNGSQPTCTVCSSLVAPSGGNFTLVSSNGLYTYAVFMCNSGYTMAGAATIICQNDGTWNASAPTCTVCDQLNSPVNGSVSFTTDGVTTEATFTCNQGTSISDATAVTTQCTTDGTWTSAPVTCETCEALSDIDSGNLTYSTNGTSTLVDYTCTSGYNINGDSLRICLSNGSWTGTNPPTCVCESPGDITNGQVTVSGDGMTATYTCDVGYSVVGTSSLHCQTDGSGWDSSTPSCFKCAGLIGPSNGNVTISTNGTSSLATYLCETGYTLTGTSQRTCESDGTWTFIAPSCVLCGGLTSPAACSYTLTYNGTNTQAVFTCDPGYYILGGSTSLLTCKTDGTWDNSEPNCVCEEPSALTNGNITVSTDGLTVTYTCDIKYSLNGTGSRLCNLDGSSWSDTAPVCVICETLQSILGGNISYNSDGVSTEALYTCDVGSTLSGVNTRTCGTDGAWNATQPSCVECPSLGSLSSGQISVSTDGTTTTALFQCTAGYYLNGDTTIQCLTTGLWSNTLQSCVCEAPGTPTDGQLVLSDNNNTATFSCDAGYILSGSSVQICGTDGSGWSGTQPSCVTCESVTAPSNGTVNVTTDGLVTLAVFSCSAGSTLDGNTILTCTQNGTWDLTPPACATCPSLPDPSSGVTSISTNGSISVAEFTCSSGYSIVGGSSVLCQTDGTWSGNVAECVCDVPSSPVNGSMTVSTDGTEVLYTCDVGTTLSGSRTRTCQSDGTGWTDTDPLCVSCSVVSSPSDGSHSISTNGTITRAAFNCSSGYTMAGSTSITCLSSGFWSDSLPTCVQCDNLSAPDSGAIVIGTDGTSSTATYTCVAGYQVSGNSILTCLSNGTWDAELPSCICTSPSSPFNGNVQISGDATMATYTCNVGYTLQGQSTRTCQSGGAGWTDTQPICSQCGSLSNILGGSISMVTTGTVTKATFSCASGYTLNGGASLTCRDDGTWDLSSPSCTSCSTLSSPTNGGATLSTDGSATVANFTCMLGYTLVGSSLLTCKADGSWDFTEPSCVKCQTLSAVPAGSVAIQTDGVTTLAQIACVSGYHISGLATLTCGTDGSWSNNLPSCVCDVPSTPGNGSLSVATDGMTVTYTCNTGYTMMGDQIVTCDVNGAMWSSTTPSCVFCANLSSQNNATVSSTSNGTTTVATYTCDVGSSISGPSTLTCLETGNWTSEESSCVECPTLSSPTDGSLTTDTNGTTTIASFTCSVGYSLNGSHTLTCQSQGTWDVLEPMCSKCETLTTVSSGSYSLTSDGHVTTALFTCGAGYHVDGASQITCSSEGAWHTSQPTCVCDAPPTQTDGSIWTSSDGMTVVYSCDLGYSIQGETTNTCNNDGSGWLYTHPTCNTCQSIVSPTNGNITTYTNGTFTKATYSCGDGYSLSSDTDISVCTETGVWNLTGLSCVKCEDLVPPSSGTIIVASTGSYTRATYSCLTGYDLEGATQRSCLTDGTWDLSAPLCVCQPPTEPTNGVTVVSADKQTVTYSCDVGYSLSGVTSRTCNTDGTGWTDADPQCVTCSTLSTISGGSVVMTTDGETTSANVSCDAGYSLNGRKLLTCRSDGTWDFSVPSCVTCDALTLSSAGSKTIITDGTTSSVTFECDNGYTLTGSQQATCSSSGTWSSTEPNCVQCNTLTDPNSGTVTMTTNGTVTQAVHTCASGYSIVGQSSLTCQADGSWDNTQPTCVCEPPTSPGHGNMTLYDSDYTATFTCESGYTLNGESLITCLQDGTGWNGSTPTCVACSSVPIPDNGTVTYSTDGLTTVVQVGCNVGFTASGKVNLTCQSDGMLDVLTPACVPCSDLQVISNGNQDLSTSGSETAVTFTCDLGYSLKGQSSSTCTSDGSWTSSEPSCVQCNTFPSITSSTHVYNTSGSTTTATVECMTGYTIVGSTTITCDTDGLWESQTSCICDNPVAPDNGALVSDGQEVVFTCDLGYSLNGSQTSYCNTDGSGWNSSVPVCVGCSTTSTPSVGQGDSYTNGSNTYLSYTCPVGYTLTGNQTITCEATGTWSALQPSCTTCVTLTSPDNGNVAIATDNMTTSALYTCTNGYYLDGTSTQTCLTDGTWSHSTPVCYCEAPSSPIHGSIEISVDKTTVSYTCDVGYSIDGVSTRVCQNDSTGWSDLQPLCVLCSTLTTPSGGQISSSTDGTITVATVTCNSGYTLDGSQHLACRNDGTWNTTVPSCVTCDSLTHPSGGTYQISSDGLTSVVQYTCSNGYTLSGTNDIQCSSTGQWLGQAPTCVLCASLATPESSNMTIVTDGFSSTAVFSCNQGYYISSSANLTCLSSGQWNDAEPECFCDPPTNITNGNYNLSVDLSEVTYSCETGYTLDGSVSRTCQGSGQGWTGSKPTCVGCSVISPPSGGSLVTSSNGSSTTTTFSCDTGFTISGEVTLQCGSDGTWSSGIPTCVECSPPTPPSNGNFTLSSNGTHTLVQFTCNLGYSLDGESTASCDTTATWTASTPNCDLCTLIGSVTNGNIVLSTTGTVTTATVTCVTGYYLKGVSSLECRPDGSWNDALPTCVCDTPLSIVNGNYTISSDGMGIDYTCDLGYTMSGSSSRSCGEDGSGWSGSPPTCTICETLASISNGNIVLTTTGAHTTASFQCDAGYSVDVTDYQATCNSDGTWNLTTPTCVSCPMLDTIVNGNVTLTTNGPESVVTYSCLQDYTLTGDQARVCLQGTWNGTQPLCLCTYSTYLKNGNAMSDGVTISYTCETGYVLDGTSSRTCQTDGTGWNLVEPVCVLCEPLTTPSSGNMSYSTDGAETTAYFTCMQGYTLTGNTQLICRTDGTWNSLEPSCGVACSALSTPQGGTVTLETDGFTTTAGYLCNAGYSLVGSTTLTCRSDGSWDLTESTCVQCESLDTPTNGYVTTSSDGSTSVATYTCHTGYYLDGTNTTTCITDGTWSHPQPTCYCTAPDTPVNGSVSLSSDKSTATFTCIEGFTLLGYSSIICQNDSTGWSGDTPVCVDCGLVPSLQDGTSSITTNGTVTSVLHTCDTGYTLSGSTTVTCLNNGTWQEQFPTCVSCQTLQSLINGSTVLSTDGVQTSAQFTCDLGYSMLGEAMSFCSVDGSWNSSIPTCVECVTIGTPASGSKSESTDGTTSHVTFTCVTGYHIEGDTDVSCLTDGSWNGSAPLCVCDVPSSPSNGQVTTGASTSVLQYTCDVGYSIDGDSQRLCSDQGAGWMGSAPSCVQCNSIQLSSNLSMTLTSNGTTSVVGFECDTGYTLDGSDQLQCLDNGTWSGNIPLCVKCIDVTAPDSGNVTITANGSISSAEYTCLAGYMIQGTATLYCNSSGSWSDVSPVCICDSPTSPANGDVSSDGVTALYTCDVGYTVYGDTTRLCQQAGLGWNGTQPSCSACSTLDAVAGGSVVMMTDGTMTTVQYTCETGYTMFGSSILTCRSDGTWDFTDTLCVPCVTLASPDNGHMNLTSDGDTTTAPFTCNTGYTLKGAAILTCRTDGNWDISAPTCVKCSELPNPESGVVSITSSGTLSSAVYTCMTGYYIISGDTTRTCGTDGVWNGTASSCVCDSPITPANGTITLNNGSMTAEFTCEVGYTLSGSALLVCQTDGSGWNDTTPSCTKCANFIDVSNSSIQYITDGQSSVAIVTCSTGTTLIGQSDIECQSDGTWNISSSPTCVSCVDLSSPVGGDVTTNSNGSVTVAEYICHTNYSISGSSHLECLNTGVWDNSPPICVQCMSIAAPSSGSVVFTSDGYTTSITYSCIPGYEVFGNSILSCLLDGTWNATEPYCVCVSPSVPDNGGISVSVDRLQVTFTCGVGYSLNGLDTSYCDVDGSGWNTTTPTCVSCTTLNEPSNGNVTLLTNQTSTYASYTCDIGYTLSGDVIRTCVHDGSWTSSDPTCVSCPTLSSPLSGTVTMTTDGLVSTVDYVCASGYDLQGVSRRTCQTDSLWDGTQPSCVCQLPAAPDNGNVTFGNDVSVALYTCDVGYSLNGTSQSNCQTDGTGWDSVSPICVVCEAVQSISGATMLLNSDGTMTTAIITCNTGYTMVGEASLTCRSDGTWNVQTPSCVTCTTLTVPDGGSVAMSSNNSVTQASFSCDSGYTLKGSPLLSCRSTGTWDLNEPECVPCPSLESPFSGNLTLVTGGQTTTATFTCMNGYYLDGVGSLTCQASGLWGGSSPVCKCTPPSEINNGNFTISDNGTVLTHFCNDGYSMNGEPNQLCDSSGNGWLGSQPSCSLCDSLTAQLNGSWSQSTNGVTVVTTFTCEEGYSLSGQSVVECQSDGTWSSIQPTCEQCSEITAPSNSTLTRTSNGTATVVSASCDLGLTVNGSAELVCLTDGSWSEPTPSCVSCTTLSNIDNGGIILATNGTVTMATYSCNPGYSLLGDAELYCDGLGSWSNNFPTCLCDAFSSPNNGAINISENGTSATFSCASGYTLSGETTVTCESTLSISGGNFTSPTCTTCTSLSAAAGSSVTLSTDGQTTSAVVTCDLGYTVAGSTNLTCRSDGTWDIQQPTCVVCASLTSPADGNVTFNSDGSETLASFLCFLGYTLVGANTLTCRSDGTWDFEVPTCVKCTVLTAPSSGQLTLSTDGYTTEATITCNNAYYINGDSMLTCGTNGVWSASMPTCVCVPPTSLNNGSISLSADGLNVTYVCNQGYTMSGESLQTCLTDGSGWSGTLPNCTKCTELQSLSSGTVTLTTDGQVTIATFTCDNGYSINGIMELTCKDDGTWNFTEPSCELCTTLSAPTHGNVGYHTNGSVTYVEYTCDSGYTMNGTTSAICLSDGTWDNTPPTCVECPAVSDPDNGQFSLTSNGSVTLATLSCISGYRVQGESPITCTSDGQWSHTEPSCLCDDFADPHNGNLVSTDNGTRAVYSCEAGYTLNGEDEVNCGTTSSNYTPPTCTICESLTTPSGATVSMTTDNTTTYAMVTCDIGYTIVGESLLSCRSDGTWNVSLPSCVTCSQLTQPDHSTVNITSIGSVTIATIACDVGYSLDGVSMVTCRSDGSWDFTMPTCVKCPDLVSPAAGNVAVSTDGIVSMATYSCVQDYYSNGSMSSVCSTLGSWSSDRPVCVCTQPTSPVQGSYDLTDGGFTAVYRCESGYTLNGSVTLTCHTDGTGWSESPPTCSECGAISPSANSSVTITFNGTQTSAEFTCDTGYSLSGTVSLTCDQTGTWSGSVPTCELCQPLTSLDNGTYTVQSNGTSTSVVYQCEEGTSIHGSGQSECTADGTWSNVSPNCVSCPTLDAPCNGAVQKSSNGSVTIATYSCLSGYSIVGESTISCLTSGQWSHNAPTCFCDDFTQLVSGNIEVSENGTAATYSCDEGYTLNGDQEITCGTASSSYITPTCTTCDSLTVPTGASVTMTTDNTTTFATVTCDTGYTVVGDGSLTCRSDGTWHTSSPNCVSCQTLDYPEGSSINITSVDSVTKAHVTCLVGYTLNGANSLTCKSDGSWDFELPTCVQCPTLTDPQAGNITLTTDGVTSLALYTCTDGYYVDGVTMTTCNTSGSWNSVPPTCKCSPPSSLTNGSYVLGDGGFTVTYSCDVGYTMSGSEVRSCDTDGSGWSGQAPNCVICEDILTDSSVTLTLNGTTSTAEFTCEAGYSIDGSFSLVCNENGTWSGNFPTCQQCTSLTAPENGSITIQSNGTTSSVSFTCGVGSTLHGESGAVCTDSGVWSFQEPLCVSCSSLSNQLNGVVAMETNGSITLATYTCDSGYKLVGEDTLMCNSDGTWNASSPLCECEIFADILNGNSTISEDGTKATFTCKEGYTLSGVTELDCAVNTSTITLPSCVTCDTLTTSSGSSSTISTEGTTTIAVISCDVGYTISGDHVMACRADGSWNISTPSCVVCETLPASNGVNITLASDGHVTTALFTCPYGFTLNGSSELVCRTDGTWNFDSPNCECDPPESVSNGEIEVSVDGLTATYNCYVGYSLSGLISRSCSTDGTWWSGADPNCTECTANPLSDGLNRTLYTDGQSTMAYFQCGYGYTITHGRNLTCLQDGSWSEEEPNCVSCPSLNGSTGLSFELMSDGLSTSASFTCGTGYTMTGFVTVTCLQNGTWGSSLPSCSAIPSTVSSDCQDQTNGAAIGLGVAFAIAAIIAIILAVVAWRYRKLYKGLGGSKASFYSAEQANWVLQDIDKHAPSKAPVGHQHHMLDVRGMSRASSQAPLSFSKRGTDMDINFTPSPALMTSRKMGGHKVPRSLTSSTFSSEASILSVFRNQGYAIDPRSSPLPEQILTARLDKDVAEHSTEIPTLRLDDTFSSFKPINLDKKSSQTSALSEQRHTTLTPSSIVVSHEISRGDSPLPQQILTPRNADDIKKEKNKRKHQQGKKGGSSKPEASLFADKRSASTLYNDTIASKLKKRGKDFVDTTTGVDLKFRTRLETPSPSFKEVDVTDIENDVSDVEV